MGLTHPSTIVSANKSLARRFLQPLIKIIKFLFLGMIGMVLIGVSTMLLPDLQNEPSTTSSEGPVYIIILLIILTYFLSIAIHELGHVGGGALAGFRFVRLGVGPFRIRREERGLRLGFVGKITFLDGFALSVPTDDHHLNRRLALMYAGGPLASLSQAISVYILLFTLREPLQLVPAPVFGFLWMLAVLGFLISIWPGRIYGFMTDGARLLTLARGGPKAECFRAMFALWGASVSGQRPRDLNPVWLQRALAISDGSADEAHLNLVAYLQALDKGEPGRAAAFLDRALSLWQVQPRFFRARYFLEAAYFEARYGRNAVTARAWLDQARGGLLVEKHTRLRAEAAVLLAEGKPEAAQARAGQALSLLERTTDRGITKAAADWLKDIVELSQIRLAASF